MHLIAAVAALLQQPADTLESLAKTFEEEKAKAFTQRTSTMAKIGALKSDAAAEFLEKVYDNAKEEDSVRSYALTCLGTCGVERATKKLFAVVKDPLPAYALRSAALSAVARTKSKEALGLLKDITKDESSTNMLRFPAFTQLQQFPLADTEAIWRQALDDANVSIRAQALRALAPLKDKGVLSRARDVLEDTIAVETLKMAAVEVWKAAGGPDMVRLFLAAGETADGNLRKALVDALASLTDEKAIELLWTVGLKDPKPPIRSLAARALGRVKHDKAFDVLEDALRDKDMDVRAAVVEAIAERKHAKSEETLRKEAQKNDETPACAAIGALALYPSKETIELLIKLAGKARLAICVAAYDALGELKTPDALPAFEKGLKSKDWQVRAAVIRGLGKLRLKESIDLLIERMGKEDGRLEGDIGTALTKLTGKALGYEQSHWKEWWKVNRDAFVFPDKAEGVGGGAGTTTYHGVPILSKRICFVLDYSGSMSAKEGAETRMELAKKELIKVLKSLPKGTMINMIFFDDRFEPWQKQLVALAPNLDKAIAAVTKLQPTGGTNIYDPLETAFQDSTVDTIFLLSDGSPGSGKFVNTEDILREIRKMNRSRQIVIHTISLGPSDFMRRLAEENGGQFVEK